MFNDDDLNAAWDRVGKAKPTGKKQTRGRYNDKGSAFISEGGALAGAATGAAIGSVVPVLGTAIGGLIGGGLGAFGGRLAENKVRDDRNFTDMSSLKDAGIEGGLTALFSAPGKALKYANTARQAKIGGSSLEDALMAAASASSTKGTGLSKVVGNKMLDASDTLATRALKMNGSQFNTDFANRTGEEVGQFATRFGLVGKSAKEVNETIYKPAQQVYAEGVKAIGTVKKDTVMETIRKQLSPQLKSPFQEDKDFAEAALKTAQDVLAKYGDEIPATELNKLKTAAYKKVDTKLVDKSGIESNKLYDVLSSGFRRSVGDAADRAGIDIDPEVLKQAGLNFKSTKLSELGEELFELNKFTQQMDVKSRIGKGALPAGLTKLSGATTGGVVGGVPGAVAGAVGTGIANSQKFNAKLTNGLDSLGKRLINGERSQVSIPGGVKMGAQGVAGASLADALIGQSESGSMMANNTDMTGMDANIANASNMDESYQGEGDMLNANPYPRENLLADIQRDPANAKKYIEYYQMLQEVYAVPEEKPMSAEAAKVTSNAQTGLQALDDFEAALANDSSLLSKRVLPGRNALGGVGGALLGTRGADAAANQIVDVIARLRTGAAITNDEAKRFQTFLPQAGDSPQVQAQKLAYLRNQFTMVANRSNTGSASLEDALMQQQGAY